ncbi:MAG: DUF1566 domain-containing protein [Legionella sp.]|nr:DUF1566 domain-containing protein [Legionella sp.]
MKIRSLLIYLLASTMAFYLPGTVNAAGLVWTFTPLTETSISVPGNGTATVQYLVTNQSAKSHRLVMTPITGITQTTTGAGICSNPFTLPSKGSSCTLSLQVQGSQLTHSITDGPIVCEQGSTLQCYKPNPSDVLNITVGANDTTLSASVSTLGLSVNDMGLNAALTGTPRRITITNTGGSPATNVTYLPSPALPSGTTISPGSCGTIPASGSCVLTITPGNTPSAASGDTNPTPITLTISGSNTNTLTPAINILTYGSVYQGGYIYAVDDTTPDTGSIGGKVAALTDQSAGVIWSSDGNSSVSYVAILAIDELSTPLSPSPTLPSYPPGTPAYVACDGKSDGACNSSNIVSYYNFNRAAGGAAPTPLDQYAAGLCKATISGESDWYLPAICEEGYDDSGSGTGCGTQASPTIQNMLSNLFDAGVGAISGEYWSSTEWSGDPTQYAWSQTFDLGNIPQNTFDKTYNTIRVRCSRVLTP